MGKYEDMLKAYRKEQGGEEQQSKPQTQQTQPAGKQQTGSKDPFSTMLENYRSGESQRKTQPAQQQPTVYEQRKARQATAAENAKNAWWEVLGLAAQDASAAATGQQRTLTAEEGRQRATAGANLAAATKENREANKIIDWDGRKELLKEYRRLDKIDNPKARQEAAAIREQLRQGDVKAGNLAEGGDMAYNFGDWTGRIVPGGVKNAAAGGYNALLTALDMNAKAQATQGPTEDELIQEWLTGQEPGSIQKQRQAGYESPEFRQFMNERYAEASAIKASAQRDLQIAKENQRPVVKAGVDIGENIIEMGADAAIAHLTGGSSLIPMAVRVFGSGAMDAREQGYSLEQQAAYGAAQAAIEVFTEKIGGIGGRGKGWSDALADKLVDELAQTTMGKNALRFLIAMAEEGGEEVLSDFMQPLANYAAGMKWDGYNAEEMLYDFFIGSVVGGMSSVKSMTLGSGNAAPQTALEQDAPKATQEAAGEPAPQGGAEIAPTGAETPTAAPALLNSQERAEGAEQTASDTSSALQAPSPQGEGSVDATQQTQTEERAAEGVGPYEVEPGAEQTAAETNEAAQDTEVPENERTLPERAGAEQARSQPGEETNRIYDELGERYGTMESGNNAVREANVPKRTTANEKVGQSVKTVLEAKATPDRVVDDIKAAVVDGRYSFTSTSRGTLAKQANEKIRRDGWQAALGEWTADVRKGKSNAKLVAMGATLLNNIMNSDASGQQAADFLADYYELMHRTGDALNAGKLIQALSPSGKLYMFQRSVERMNEAKRDMATRKAEKTVRKAERKARNEAKNPGRKAGDLDAQNMPGLKEGQDRGITETDNVPVEQWAQKAGESVAESLGEKLRSEASAKVKADKIKTVCEIAEQDIKKLFQAYGTQSKNIDQRALENILANPSFYNDLYNSVRANLEAKAGMSAEEIAKMGRDWIDAPLADMLAQMATKQSDIHIDNKLVEDYMNVEKLRDENGNALSAEEQDRMRDDIMDKMIQNIADQTPSTIGEKIRAIRYLNMLGNLKTQVRNVAGNLGMMALTYAKNRAKAAAELAISAVSGGEYERTTSVFIPPALRKEASADFSQVRDVAVGEGKYSDTTGDAIQQKVADKKRVLKASGEWGTDQAKSAFMRSNAAKAVRKAVDAALWLPEQYRKATKWAMEKGDEIFIRATYATELAGYLKAHKVTSISEASPELMERARAYAIKQAQEATFHDSNAVSNYVSGIGRNAPPLVKAVSEGALPFRKTPANVFVRGFEYSPLGLLTTAKVAFDAATSKTDATGQDVVDSLTKNLTGIGMFVLGAYLHKLNKLRTKEDDKEKENFQKQQGQQDWSLVLDDGKSYTLDWASPAALPLFMGAVFDQLKGEDDLTGNKLLQIAGTLTEPMMEMSMLSGLNDSMSASTGYGATLSPIEQFALNSVLNWVGQFGSNSILRQSEQAYHENRMTSWTDADSMVPEIVQKTVTSLGAAIPGWDYQQTEYIDGWGRKQSNGSAGGRALQAYANPGYVGRDRSTPYDKELERLYEAGALKQLPTAPSRSTEVDKQRLSPEEYETYATVAGQKKLELVGDFLDSEEYKNLNDEERAEVIGNLYEYANYQAKKAVMAERGGKLRETSDTKSMEKLVSLEKEGGVVYDYLFAKQGLKTAVAAKDYSGVDALLGDIDKMDKATKEQLFADVNRLDDRVAAHKAGIDTVLWEAAYAQKKKLEEDKNTTAVQDTISFAQWADSQKDLNRKQKDLLRDQMGFYTTFRAEAEKFDQMTGAGLSPDKSGTAWNTIHDLKPLEGKSTVSAAQKVQAISGMRGFSDAEKWTVFACYLQKSNESLYKKAMKAKDSGKSFDQWAKEYAGSSGSSSGSDALSFITGGGSSGSSSGSSSGGDALSFITGGRG